jgi:hypothetical protein
LSYLEDERLKEKKKTSIDTSASLHILAGIAIEIPLHSPFTSLYYVY